MARECLNCGNGILRHAVKDVAYQYKGHAATVPKIAGWHCPHCREVEFDSGEGKRFAAAIKRIAEEIDAREAGELSRIRKKLKLTQVEAARITGGGPNAFSRYERGKTRPLPAVTNLFRLLDRHPELLDELES
ncbi:MAG: type II toxin-antitoxin system MqsA family antitoxin [Burkholderiales bacterium]